MSTALAKAPSAARTVFDYLQGDNVKDQIALALPSFLTPDRMVRIALTTINRNSKLQECTTVSLGLSLLQASQMGIEPDGRNGHLIPRWNSKANAYECTFLPDYKGLVGLLRRDPNVADVYADLVRDADTFSLVSGLNRDIVHKIDITRKRGEILGAYAVIKYKDGTNSFDFMSKEDIDAIRARSQSSGNGPWVSDYGEMAKKTVIKRLLKLADLSPDIAERAAALDVDATVTRVEPPRIEQPRFEQQPPAALPAPAEQPATTRGKRVMKLVRAETVEKPAPPPDDDNIPLPGAEPEPQPEPQPAAESEPALSPADAFRKQHPTATDAELLRILIMYRLAEPSTKTLEDVPAMKMEQALGDPSTLAGELAELKAAAKK